ncbi:MAG TPA: HEAT repeat domain-containing protein, partial [Kofleriaceae bacterium]|nr:HEAT repeat domain-containing protein [Kofleriaceae bacterium]
MAKNLGSAIIELLDSDRVDLRAAAATVLAAVGKGDKAVEAALTSRLADPDGGVRRIALEGLAGMGASGIAAQLVPLLRAGDEPLAERAAQVLAQQGAAAESALRKELGEGPVAARRVMAQLLLRRGTQPAVEAVVDQLSDEELGEQALQLLRHELDQGNEKLAHLIEKIAVARAADASKDLAKAWAKAQQAAAAAAKLVKAAKGAKTARTAATADAAAKPSKRKAASGPNGAPLAASAPAAPAAPVAPPDPLREPDVTRGAAALGGLLRLIGYLARPSTQSLLLRYAAAEQPRPIRL